MYLHGLFSLSIILVFSINDSTSQDSSKDFCVLWGDPHLVMFSVHASLEDRRAAFWCQSEGPLQMLKNKYIEINVNVTEKPYWNENFEIKLFAGPDTTICTITPQNFACNHIFLKVEKIDSTMTIDYYEADELSLIINSYTNENRTVYDITISQTYSLIRQSSGLCVNKKAECVPEHAANLQGKRRKRNLDRQVAARVCDEYMKQAYVTARAEFGNTGSKLAEHARAACINDVSLTADPSWGQSAIHFVAMDALKVAKLKTEERQKKMRTFSSAVSRAVARAKENTCDCITRTTTARSFS